MRSFRARGVVRGRAEGSALVCESAFSFLGDVDMETGEIIAQGHPLAGESIAGKVLIYPETKGSSGGCVVLMVLAKAGKKPAAIIILRPADPNIVEGAILAGVPLLTEPEQDFQARVQTGHHISVDGATGQIQMTDTPGAVSWRSG